MVHCAIYALQVYKKSYAVNLQNTDYKYNIKTQPVRLLLLTLM